VHVLNFCPLNERKSHFFGNFYPTAFDNPEVGSHFTFPEKGGVAGIKLDDALTD